MAEIYLARLAGEAGFEKIVVVKRLHPALAAADDYVRMFLDEGKLVARLDHPNVCEVHELGRDGSDYFLAMPFLDGVAATELIARVRDPNRIAQLRVAAGVAIQACAGLHHAHELRGADGAPLGLVHRDASPSNLFVTTSGVVKVLDFGIAKVRGAQATEVGVIKGKWQYMAPEQVLGEELDRRCDVFALGIVLFELATHQRLFKRDSEFLAARALLEEPIPRAHEVDPAVPRALSDVIAKALARIKDERYPDARAFASAIEDAMAPHGSIATAPEIAAALAAEHAAELTAQRTRRLRVVENAREASVVATVRRAVPEQTPRAGEIGVPTSRGVMPASNVASIDVDLDDTRPGRNPTGAPSTVGDLAAPSPPSRGAGLASTVRRDDHDLAVTPSPTADVTPAAAPVTSRDVAARSAGTTTSSPSAKLATAAT